MTESECKSCGEKCFWASIRPSGKATLVNFEPDESGNLAVIPRTPAPGAKPPLMAWVRVLKFDEARGFTGLKYRSHFATCPNAGEHRRPK